MHSMKSEARLMNSAKLKRMGLDDKTEGKMYGAEAMPPMMDTVKPAGAMPNKKRFATGGAVLGDVDGMDGDAPPRRLDKAKRGKGGSTVNIVIAPQGGGDAAPKPPGPPMGMVAPPTPAAPPQQSPQIPPAALAAMLGGAGGGQKPPGLKTGGRAPFKRGGAVKRADGGAVAGLGSRIAAALSGRNADVAKSGTPAEQLPPQRSEGLDPADHGNGGSDSARKHGGKVQRATGGKVYDAGAGTGEGRLEKKAAYGKRSREGEGR